MADAKPRALRKDGQPRKVRSDKGVKRTTMTRSRKVRARCETDLKKAKIGEKAKARLKSKGVRFGCAAAYYVSKVPSETRTKVRTAAAQLAAKRYAQGKTKFARVTATDVATANLKFNPTSKAVIVRSTPGPYHQNLFKPRKTTTTKKKKTTKAKTDIHNKIPVAKKPSKKQLAALKRGRDILKKKRQAAKKGSK